MRKFRGEISFQLIPWEFFGFHLNFRLVWTRIYEIDFPLTRLYSFFSVINCIKNNDEVSKSFSERPYWRKKIGTQQST